MSAEREFPSDVAWDEALAVELLNSIVLVGLTFVDREDNLISKEEFWGEIARADRQAGIQIDLRGTRAGDDYWLPADMRSFDRAAPGEYRLRSTGEVVVNPVFTSTWTITKPDH